MKNKTYRISSLIQLNRRWMLPLVRLILRSISRLKIYGKENIPAGGGYLVAVNHVSLYEAPFMLGYWPKALEAAGASDLWDRKGQSSLVRLYGAIPVHRGEFDRQLIETILLALAAGRPVLIMPEGERSHAPGMQRAHPGTAYLVDKSQAPVVPVGIVGTTEDFLKRALRGERPEVTIRIGQPLSFPKVEGKGRVRRINLQANVDQLMYAIAALLPPEYRGVYDGRKLHPTET